MRDEGDSCESCCCDSSSSTQPIIQFTYKDSVEENPPSCLHALHNNTTVIAKRIIYIRF